jgi:hypothetical protein
MLRIEYDDGKPAKQKEGRVPQAVPKGRERGFYVVMPDGAERRIPIGHMKVGEIAAVEQLLNELCGHGEMADTQG